MSYEWSDVRDSSYRSVAPGIANETEWRDAFALDLEQLFTSAGGLWLPRVLIPLIAGYCTPAFVDFMRCHTWIERVLRTIPPERLDIPSSTLYQFRYQFGAKPDKQSIVAPTFLVDTNLCVVVQFRGVADAIAKPQRAAVHELLSRIVAASREERPPPRARAWWQRGTSDEADPRFRHRLATAVDGDLGRSASNFWIVAPIPESTLCLTFTSTEMQSFE